MSSHARVAGLLRVSVFAAFVMSSSSGMLSAGEKSAPPEMRLSTWERGIGLSSSADARAFIYLRFYEWHLFDAVAEGQHHSGNDRWPWQVSDEQQHATLDTDLYRAKITAVDDGATMELTVKNTTQHDWPEIAAIIPCVSPEYVKWGVPENPFFFDEDHQRTWYLSRQGLRRLQAREIHFNQQWKDQILRRSRDGAGDFEKFSYKWPTSDVDATEGLMVRESVDRSWVAGVAWDHFLSSQGHNPRKCMHLSIRVGPLKVGESKTIQGKLYLFPGTKEDCVSRFRRDFASRK